ncbi:transposase [Rodentibacter caecimuris]|nr:transposase [Rodentibacter heylii]
MNLYPNRKTIRAAWNNYQNGAYFITICTKHKQHFFGEIHNEKMYLSLVGKKLRDLMQQTIELRKPQFIEIPIYTIMPNHLHFIIIINTDFDISQHYFRHQSQNVSSVVRGIKSALTSYAIKNNIPFEWQPRFHDRIIRNEREFTHIYQYIENNVINWDKDCFY